MTGAFTQPLTFNNSANVYGGASLEVTGTAAANLFNSTTGYQIGGTTIFNADSKSDVMIGSGAGNGSITGGSSQIIGDGAGSSMTSGNADVFIGSNAGARNTTGNGNVYIGWNAAPTGTTAAYNTVVGGQAGYAGTTGIENTFLGFGAGQSITTGGGNLFLGVNAGISTTTGNSNIYLGNAGANESNTIRIGDSTTQGAAYIAGIYGVTLGSGVPVYINSNGQLGTLTSSQKYKEQIQRHGRQHQRPDEAAPRDLPLQTRIRQGRAHAAVRADRRGSRQGVSQTWWPTTPTARRIPCAISSSPACCLNEVQKQYHREQQQAEVIKSQQQQIDELKDRLARIESMLGGQTPAAQAPLANSLP